MKRGMSHIEMVLAFVLFIGAAGFAVFLLRASLTQQEADIQSDILLERIIQQLSTSVTKQLFVVNVTLVEPYYTLTLPSNPSLPLRVVSLQGIPIQAAQQGTTLTIAREGGTSIYLLSSAGLTPLPSNVLLPTQPGTGTFGAEREEQMVSEQAAHLLAQQYVSSYPSLQQSLALPFGITFSFRITNGTGTLAEGVQQPPRGVNVQASTQRRALLHTDGREAFVTVEVRAW